jgi:hypothetical protein
MNDRIAVFEGGHRLLSEEEAFQEKRMMDDLAVKEQWDAAWWNPRWFPFASDHAGQLLVVHDTTGEVIEFLHDDDPRPLLAASLTAFVSSTLARLQSGELAFRKYGVTSAQVSSRTRETAHAREELEKKYAARAKWFPVFAVIVIALLVFLVLMLERSR